MFRFVWLVGCLLCRLVGLFGWLVGCGCFKLFGGLICSLVGLCHLDHDLGGGGRVGQVFHFL